MVEPVLDTELVLDLVPPASPDVEEIVVVLCVVVVTVVTLVVVS